MKSIPLYNFYKHKYGNELLVDVIEIDTMKDDISQYNCIEVFQKEVNGEWQVIHSTWSFIRPMDKKFGTEKEIV